MTLNMFADMFATVRRLTRSLAELGFQYFREVIAAASSVGTWMCLVWIAWVARGHHPPAAALLALPLIYAINAGVHRKERAQLRRVPASFRERLTQAGVRMWVACSFASLIAAAALSVVVTIWCFGHVSFDTMSVQARPLALPPPSAAEIDPVLRWLGTLAMAAAALSVGYGYTVGQRRIDFTDTSIPVRDLPGQLEGLRLVQISDLHIGPYLAQEQLAGYVDMVNSLHPDVIVITGDIVDQRVTDLDDSLPVLARLRAPHGVIVILGNHDHRVGSNAVAARLAHHTDFTVLRDGRTTIGTRRGRLHFVGIEDRGGAIKRGAHEEKRLARLLAEIPAGDPVVLLTHRPELFDGAARAGVALTLSGHTHGGQVALRLGRQRVLGPGNLMSRFTRGLFHQGDSYLYVNRGLGVVAQPVRVGALREVALLRLVTAPERAGALPVAAYTAVRLPRAAVKAGTAAA